MTHNDDKPDIASTAVLRQLQNCMTVARAERQESLKDVSRADGKITAIQDAIQVVERELRLNKDN